ncbi:MAG: SDR family oxidoreductase [Acidimicrobiales bacterium]
MLPLGGRRVVVVGASSGIGRATALAAVREGATVALAARRREDLDAAAHDAGPRAGAFVADVTDEDSVSRLVEDVTSWMGGLDTVVYAAGQARLGLLAEVTAEQWRATWATNVTGAALVVARSLPHLRRSERACVTLLSSHSVGRPWPGLVPYAASKAGLDELARGLRVEEPGLRVLRVVVGNTATGFADHWEPGAATAALERWAAEGYLRHRVLAPAEVADAVVAALADTGPERADTLHVVGDDLGQDAGAGRQRPNPGPRGRVPEAGT